MNIQNFEVRSSDKIHTLKGVVYIPNGQIKGLFHIVHGMTEHIKRYDSLMSELANLGYLAFGYDNLGHGVTAEEFQDFGFIAKKDGHEFLAKDVKIFSDAIKAEFDKENNRPYFLLGHSMGSFITRYALSKYVKPTKYIIMGTGGKNPAATPGLAIISLIRLFRGDKYISSFINDIAFSGYNKRFGGGTKQDPSPWLTNDVNQRNKYYGDKYCTFKFTVSAMGDLIRLIKFTNLNKWYKNLPKDSPILLLSGDNDPVGNYGKGILEIKNKLVKNGINAKAILYKTARHEVLNDFCHDQVKQDILDFINE